MCGKFIQIAEDGRLETVMPMHFARVLHLDSEGARRTSRMRWGFVRASAGDPFEKPDHIHARAETLDEKQTFRDAFLRGRRGLLMVRRFNEGREISPKRTEQYVITPRDEKDIAIAVLFERWTHRTQGELLTYVMVTTPANALIAAISDRMPAVLGEKDWAKWLGEDAASPEELKAMLKAFPGDWTMEPEKKPAKPKPADESQPSLF